MSQNGKGSNQRPTDLKKYRSEHDRIFGKKEVEIEPIVCECGQAMEFIGKGLFVCPRCP
jgi:hypothetical protein